jgi:eukaryotic-like serine/threonine-protein kinase
VMKKYRLIAELGHGGMADVFLAVAAGPAGFNKLVVIKQLRPSLVEDEEFLTMFLDEARLAARLNHPNVIHTYEVGQDEALPYLAMEYLDGQPLHRVLQKMGRDKGGLPIEAHLRILCDSLVGLHYAHELADYDGTPLNVVHRDVTPQNIFITYEGAIKVVDFGIAKAMNQTVETRTGVIKGKIAYMSPEQARSEDIDRRSDIFAVGVMLWEAATGRRLWKGMSDVTVLQRLVSSVPLPSPRSVNPDVPERLERICLKALAFSPDERYVSAAELQTDLESFLDKAYGRVNGRDVGKLISERFSKEREVMHTTIDQQLKGVQNAGWSGTFTLPKLDSPLVRTHFGAGYGEETPASGQLFGVASGSQNSLTGAAAVAPVAPPVSARPSRARRAAAVALLLAAGATGAWAVAVGRPGGAASSLEPGARAALEARVPAEVALNVKATPPSAQIFLDDERLEGNPYRGRRPRSAEAHRLRAEAPGYATQVREIVLGSDLTVELSLEHEPTASAEPGKSAGKAAPPRWTPPPKAPPKPASPTPPAPPKAKPSVTLDTDNPWLDTAPGSPSPSPPPSVSRSPRRPSRSPAPTARPPRAKSSTRRRSATSAASSCSTRASTTRR